MLVVENGEIQKHHALIQLYYNIYISKYIARINDCLQNNLRKLFAADVVCIAVSRRRYGDMGSIYCSNRLWVTIVHSILAG